MNVFKTLPLALACAAVLTGCAVTGASSEGGAEATASAAPAAKKICLFANEALKSPKIDEAVMIGLKQSGFEVELLAAPKKDEKIDRSKCPLCAAYGFEVSGKEIRGVVFQVSGADGKPMRARGPAKDGKLTLEDVARYAFNLGRALQNPQSVQGAAAAPGEGK